MSQEQKSSFKESKSPVSQHEAGRRWRRRRKLRLSDGADMFLKGVIFQKGAINDLEIHNEKHGLYYCYLFS